jgi:hypothetical protein
MESLRVESRNPGERPRNPINRNGIGSRPRRLMMKIGPFELEYLAFIAFHQLSEAEQAAVKERLEALANLPPSEWPGRVIRRPNVLDPYYEVPIDASLRALFSARAGHKPVVEAIDYVDRLLQYANTR